MKASQLCPKTLRWLAREAHKELNLFPMYEYGKGFNAGMEHVKRTCRRQARAIESAAKRKKTTR